MICGRKTFAAYRRHGLRRDGRSPTVRSDRRPERQCVAAGFALAPRTGRPDLGGQLLLDALELVHIDVDDFGAVFEVEARVVATEARPGAMSPPPRKLEDW